MFHPCTPNAAQASAVCSVLAAAALALLSGCSGGGSAPSPQSNYSTATTSPSPPSKLSITTTSLSSGMVDTSYRATLAASGGTPPYQWSVSRGALPAGLTLAAATGVISGTPTAEEDTAPVTLEVYDSGTPHQSRSESLSITINPTALLVTGDSLPTGQVSDAYSAKLSASGGKPPYRWTISSGALPAGLTLTPTGVISGTPTTTENAETFTVQVLDSWRPGQTSSHALRVTINPTPLRIATTSLPGGQVSAVYSTTLAASGGTPPYQWSVSSGALPPGLTLAASTGAISGTPTKAENAEAVTIQVSDAGTPRQTSSEPLSVMIGPPTLRITTTSLPTGKAGTGYGATLAASGGTPPYQWSVSSGALPPGLTLAASTGVISGTPTTPEHAEAVSIQISDSGTPPQSSSRSLGVTISPSAMRVATTSLPPGKVSIPYNSSLAAFGGTAPYQWSLSSGSLPMGLTLASTGVISGTPTVPVNATQVTFEITDSGAPAQIGFTPLTLTVNPLNITISIAPAGAALTVTQVATLAATTNDFAGVSWSISPSGGALSSTQSLTAVPIELTAPSAAGVYSLTATSVTDPTQAASIPVAVTDLAGVSTYHNDIARDGVNGQEYALTPSNVALGFGKIFSCTVDGAVYAQPLWAANLTVGGSQHNVVFVATAHDSLFAFDADASPCVELWQVSLIDAAHGATVGETPVPSGPTGYLVGGGSGDITPEVGIIGTPVIDSASGTLYVVSKSTASVLGSAQFYQRLHAIDVTTGLEKASSPVVIAGNYPGSGDGASIVTWNARQENQRPGLVFVNGTVCIAWGSHEDNPPYYGWIMGYRYGASGFTQVSVLNVTPNVQYGGIWMSGAAPSADSNGNLFLVTGNGGFDATNASPPNNDYGDTFLELSFNSVPGAPQSGFWVPQWFTPSDQQTDDADDQDFGASGASVLADIVAGDPPATVHLVVAGGKDGNLYLLDRDRMGGYGDVNAWQEIVTGHALYSTAAFWNDTIYLVPADGPLTSYSLVTSAGFQLEYLAASPAGGFGWPGATPSVSASGETNAIIWALDSSLFCTNRSQGCGSAVLHAYDPANQLNEIWNSSLATDGADAAGNAVKFTVPTIANGKVYVGSRGNNTGGATASTTIPGELDVYGLKSNRPDHAPPRAASILRDVRSK